MLRDLQEETDEEETESPTKERKKREPEEEEQKEEKEEEHEVSVGHGRPNLPTLVPELGGRGPLPEPLPSRLHHGRLLLHRQDAHLHRFEEKAVGAFEEREVVLWEVRQIQKQGEEVVDEADVHSPWAGRRPDSRETRIRGGSRTGGGGGGAGPGPGRGWSRSLYPPTAPSFSRHSSRK